MRACILSSYPRSGNTWARFVIATAVLGRRPSSAELDRLTPDAHKPVARPEDWLATPGLLLKSHFTPGNLAKYLQALAQAVAGRVQFDEVRAVHIVRNPFDVARSVARFYETEDADFPGFLRRFVEPAPKFPAAFVKWGFSSWHGNGVAWSAQARAAAPSVTIIRYEDLIARPEAEFGRIFEAFGVEAQMPLADALDLCAPTALRQAEDKEIAAGAPGLFQTYRQDARRATTRFINEARAGGYRDVLSDGEIAYGLEKLGGLMERLGYDTDLYRAAA